VNVEPLRNWLKLPAGAWPPDHYTLLGLPPGDGDVDTIENRVLDRMDQLRRYQLSQPDLVTEGMNRLAQAQICLTDPTARDAYDMALLGRSRPVPKPKPKPKKVEASAKVEVVDDLPPGVQVIDYHRDMAPLPIMEEEQVVLTLEEEKEESRPVYELIEPAPLPAMLGIEDPTPVSEIRPDAKQQRREIYRQIVRVRKVLRVWERLKLWLADPTHPLNRRVDSIAFAGLLNELRPLLPTVNEMVGNPDKPGKLVAALARQGLASETFRGLLPSQREALAADWIAGRAELVRVQRRLRDEVNHMIDKPWSVRIGWPIVRNLSKAPELIFLALGSFALLVALIRSMPRGL